MSSWHYLCDLINHQRGRASPSTSTDDKIPLAPLYSHLSWIVSPGCVQQPHLLTTRANMSVNGRQEYIYPHQRCRLAYSISPGGWCIWRSSTAAALTIRWRLLSRLNVSNRGRWDRIKAQILQWYSFRYDEPLGMVRHGGRRSFRLCCRSMGGPAVGIAVIAVLF
jgi:hypothetical protein